MKTGTYLVSFEVELTNCDDEQHATDAIRGYVEEMMEDDLFPKLNFELIDGVDQEYTEEEETVSELNF